MNDERQAFEAWFQAHRGEALKMSEAFKAGAGWQAARAASPVPSKAVEFAEYLAKRAEQFIDASDGAMLKRAVLDGAPHNDHRPLLVDQSEQAQDDAVDARRALLSSIYEFRKRAMLAASPASPAQQPAQDETGWLIEHSGEVVPDAPKGQVSWLCVAPSLKGFGLSLSYTIDTGKALRFARERDAQQVLNMYLGPSPAEYFKKPFSVTQHCWPADAQPPTPQPPQGAQQEPLT
jgi:hypothetical protein